MASKSTSTQVSRENGASSRNSLPYIRYAKLITLYASFMKATHQTTKRRGAHISPRLRSLRHLLLCN